MSNRKYTEVQGWWIYTIYVPSINKYYIGISGQENCYQRWQKCQYKGGSLEPYLSEWESMEKTVLMDGLTYEEALKFEDNIIQRFKVNDLCINKYRSGWIAKNDKNAYRREKRKQQNQLTLFDLAS